MKAFVWTTILSQFSLLLCQVQVPGKYRPSESFSQMALGIQAIFSLPPMDNFQLMVKDMADQKAHPKPFKFAEAIPVTLDVLHDGEWTDRPELGIREWKLAISSPGATSIGLLFEDFYLPDEAELFVVGREYTLGGFTGNVNNKEDGKFATTPVHGDAVILVYVEPLNRPKTLPVRIRLDYVTHGFRAPLKDYRGSGSCNIDVACSEGDAWKTQTRSVAMMLTDYGTRFCTGAMVNNVMKDRAQFLLTANHCIIGDVSRMILAFNYELDRCDVGAQNLTISEPRLQTVQGVRLLAKWDQSDFALLMVNEKIPNSYNVYLAGWELAKRPPSNVIGIHHPSGDVKKISIFTGNTTAAAWQEGPINKYHWNIPHWTKGITEPGSSGSPLFNQMGLIVGHLHGGQSSCQVPLGYDMYGGVAFDWAAGPTKAKRLRDWLNPQGRAVSAMLGMELAQPSKTNSLLSDMEQVNDVVVPELVIERLIEEPEQQIEQIDVNSVINTIEVEAIEK